MILPSGSQVVTGENCPKIHLVTFFRTTTNPRVIAISFHLLLVDVMSTPSTSAEPPLKRVNGPPADLSECRERLIRFCYSIALLATARKSVNSSSRSFFSFAATLHMCVVPSAAARIFTSKPRDWFLSQALVKR